MKLLFFCLIIPVCLFVFPTCGFAQCPAGNLFLTTQGAVDSFSVIYPLCKQLKFNIYVNAPTIRSLKGLSGVTSSEADISIGGTALTTLDGLNNLYYVKGSINLTQNDSLISLNGLNHLDSVGGTIEIATHVNLNNVDALSNLTYVRGYLVFGDNLALTSLSGLSGLKSVGADFLLAGNISLKTTAGFSALQSVGGSFQIQLNTSLMDLNGFDKLSFIGSNFIVGANPALKSVSGLKKLAYVGNEITIFNSPALTSLAGLQNIQSASVKNLTIQNSPSLSVCQVKGFCDYLSVPTNPRSISGNAKGCNSDVEIQALCKSMILPVENINLSAGHIFPNPANEYVIIAGLFEKSPYKMINIQGQILQTGEIGSDGLISVSGLPAGMYFLKTGSRTAKFVKN